MDIEDGPGEVSDGNNERVIGCWRKENPCFSFRELD